MIYNHQIGSIYHLCTSYIYIYIANWVIVCYLPPIKGTRFHSIDIVLFFFFQPFAGEFKWKSLSHQSKFGMLVKIGVLSRETPMHK